MAKGKMKKRAVDTYRYRGWLVSDRFLKRAFAILGYSFVASLIFYGILLAILLVIGVIFGGAMVMMKAVYS